MPTTIIEQLENILDERDIIRGDAIAQRGTGYWDNKAIEAKAIVLPRSTEQVCAILTCCYEAGQTVVTHGGRTGCAQAEKSCSEDIVLSLECMHEIEEIDVVGRTVTVQAGCVLQTLQEKVETEGLYFPLDFGARGSCTVGGNVATNAGGMNVIRYGMTRELILGLEVVLADGRLVTSMNRMLKNNAGYDLKHLFIGTEGTLGIVTRIVFKLKELPLSTNSALVGLENFEHVGQLLKHMDCVLGGSLSAYEVMWGNYFKEVTQAGWHRAPMSRDYPYYVLMETQGAEQRSDESGFQVALEQAFEKGLIIDAILPKSRAERNSVWAIREDFEAILRYKPNFLYDVSLPIKDMDAYVNELQQAFDKKWSNIRFYVLGHIGDGNLHLFISPGIETKDLHKQVDAIVYPPLRELGGSVSAEHGIGLEKKTYLSYSRTKIEIDMMRALKNLFDNKNILNPGKVFDLC